MVVEKVGKAMGEKVGEEGVDVVEPLTTPCTRPIKYGETKNIDMNGIPLFISLSYNIQYNIVMQAYWP